MAEETLDLAKLDEIIKGAGQERGALIPILQRAQRAYGYLPRELLKTISKRLSVPFSRVFGVATFYSLLSVRPRGRHVVRICESAPCHVQGGAALYRALQEELSIEPGQTTPDDLFTLETTSCLGRCAEGASLSGRRQPLLPGYT